MEGSKPDNPEVNRQALEVQAFQLRNEGRMPLALEKIEQAMDLDEQWYYSFYKSIWLWESNRASDAVKVIQNGLNFERPKEFFFRYLSADVLFRTAIAPQNTLADTETSIKELDSAIGEVNTAELLLFRNSR